MRSLAPLVLVVLTGCVTTIRFPPDLWSSEWDSGWWFTGDTGATATEEPPVVPRQVDAVAASCDVDGAAWTFRAKTDGWTREVRINVFRTSDAQEEEHLMRLVSTDPEGTWDEVRAGPLPDATPVVDQVPEVNTRFDCAADATTLSFVVRVWTEGDTLTDCVVWGADPEATTARIRMLDPDVLGLGGCREVEGGP